MSELHADRGLLLVLDTCGERASLALFRGSDLIEEQQLEERTASAALLGALRSMLAREQVTVADLAALGVVSGPGSFTGVRVGMALAKGLCEAVGIPLAAVSRLRVLAEAAGLRSGFAVLAAGRDQVYALEIGATGEARERLTSIEQIAAMLHGREVAAGSAELAEKLHDAGPVRWVELTARQAIGEVQRCLAAGGSDLARTDANYVRNEDAIYRKAAVAAGANGAG